MNPTRPAALPVKWNWRTVGVYIFLLIGSASPAGASPKAVHKDRDRQPDTSPSPEQQGVTPKDLLLTPQEEKRADALASFIDGNLAEDNADVDRALDDYRKVLAFDPSAKISNEDEGNTQMLLAGKVAFELARRGDPASGIDILKDTIKAAPDEPMTYYFLSEIYSKFLKKYDVALKYSDQTLKLDPGNFVFYVANYELQMNLGQPRKAVEVVDRASKLDTGDTQYLLKLAELYIHAMVKSDGSAAPDDLKKMNASFQKILAVAKDDAVTIAKVADFYVLTKQIKDAIPLYLKTLNLKRDSTDPMLSTVREKLAGSYIATGQSEEAIRSLEDLIKSDPLRSGTYEMLGRLYADKGEYNKALNSYQQTLLLNPSDPRNYLRVSETMFELKQFDKAVELLRDTHKRFPELPRVTYELGQALGFAKKHQEALSVFEEAVAEAQSTESEMLDGEFYFNYGAAAEQAGMLEKAAEMFKKSISLDPGNAARAYNYLGFMWVDRGQNLDEGGNLIKRAVQMEPDNAAFIDSLGWYYYKKNEPEKALPELLKAAATIKPEDAVVDEHIGDAYQKLGRVAEATNYWRKAIALDPDNKGLADKIESAKEKVTLRPPIPEKPVAHP